MASLTDDPPAPPRKSMRMVFTEMFPFLARLGLSSSGALAIKSAAGRTELEGGGAGVARVDDVAGYEYLEVVTAAGVVVAAALYRSRANGAASSWAPVASGASPPVNGVTVGTPITITTGSAKVTCG